MAKNNTTSGKGKGILAFFLALILGAGATTFVFWDDVKEKFSNSSTETTDKNDEGKDDEKDNETNTGTSTENEKHDNMLVSDVENNGVTLAMTPLLASELSPQAESGLTLTATVSPAEATDKTLDWTVEWADSANAWAQGKKATDYVTITPASDGSNVATVECLKDFGAQLIAKAISRSNPNAYAMCTLDYYARITGATARIGSTNLAMEDAVLGLIFGWTGFASVNINEGGKNELITNDICGTSDIQITYKTSSHTIPLAVEEATITEYIRIDSDFAQYLNDNGISVLNQYSSTGIPTIPGELTDDFDIKYYGLFFSYYNRLIVPGFDPYPTFEDYKAQFGAKYLSLANNYTGPAIIISLQYQDEMNYATFALSLSYQSNYFNIAVENVEMNNTGEVL